MPDSKANIFAAASAKAKSTMEQAAKPKAAPKGDEKVVNVRMSAELHKAAWLHRMKYDESMNALIVRLLEKELRPELDEVRQNEY